MFHLLRFFIRRIDYWKFGFKERSVLHPLNKIHFRWFANCQISTEKYEFENIVDILLADENI